MSGIVGMVNGDGAWIDNEVLEQMTSFLAFRGPDAQAAWVDGSVGFGHALLRTTEESEREQQPCSLDGQVWITADARIDDRANLVGKLAGHGRKATLAAPDVELILHAYHAWGERCVEHLLGDFAFAIWNGRERQLFCARDHFGVKPFFYAVMGNTLIFSNTLNCARLHPAVSARLNERAIGDFLLFGWNQDPAISVFADVQRLPAAHVLTWSAQGLRLQRYWTLPTDGDIRYRREAEYVEHFKDLLRRAVEDRLRTNRVAIYMSGGLDSSAVAAAARKLTPAGHDLDLRAYTIVYDGLIPDVERHYSGLVSRALDIPIFHHVADDYRLYERQDQEELHTPEPLQNSLSLLTADLYPQIAAHARVVLSGDGGDPAFLGSSVYALNLLKRGRLGRLAGDIWCCLAHGLLPKVGFRARLRRWLGKTWAYPYPNWLNTDLEARLGLRARWQQVNAPLPHIHPRRPEAYQSLTPSYWPQMVFEDSEPGVTRCPFEVRYPFFDVRLLAFVLAIPAIPWCDQKELLRCALSGLIPDTIRLRPKTPLQGDPVRARLCREDYGWLDRFESSPDLERFVDRPRLARIAGEADSDRFLLNTRPYFLNNWLRLAARSSPPLKSRCRDDLREERPKAVARF